MEVLRLEIRLNKRQVMKSLFKKLGIAAELEFERLFSSQISKAVLNHFYSQIMAEIRMVELLKIDTTKPIELAEAISKDNPSIKPAKSAQIIGAMCLIQKAGANGLKNLFPHNHKRTISRMIAECQQYAPKEQTRWLAISSVKQQLDRYEPISIIKYQMVNSS
jgi:hypothetical protein